MRMTPTVDALLAQLKEAGHSPDTVIRFPGDASTSLAWTQGNRKIELLLSYVSGLGQYVWSCDGFEHGCHRERLGMWVATEGIRVLSHLKWLEETP